MCGIAGAVTSGAGRLPDRETAERMCQVIRHRGPDDQGIYYEDPAFLGMRRLSIIDLEGGHQPIRNEDGTIWLVFNGEIYNFHDLRRDLEAKGHSFYTHSDSECIVHCYEEYGEDFVERLRGMFAIAIWDGRERKLLLARDRLGKKPLYYADLGDGLAFGSEIKSLLEIPAVGRSIAPGSVRDFLVLGYIPTPASIFQGVSKLPAGHCLVYSDGRVSVRRYWQLRFEPKWEEGEEALADRLYGLLDEAVRVRLVSDVPFGAFLSGGLDSSVVVALMARHLGSPVKTFTIGFREEEFSELPDARVVARHVGAEHHELVVEADAVSLLQELVWYFDEPFGDSSAIPTYLVSKLAAGHVKMVLSGDGGDELFAGYERYRKYRAVRGLGALPLGGLGASWVGSLIPGRTGERARWLARRARMSYPDDYLSGVALTTAELAGELLREGPGLDGIFERVRGHFLREDVTSWLDRILAGDMDSYLVDDILVKVDRMSMANSLEARAPLLDHELAEFAARLPLSAKMSGGTGKRLLRAVAARLLPASCLRKGKQGFAIPLARWFRGELNELMMDTLSSASFRQRGVFDPEAARKCAEDHVAGLADHGEHLWLILTFELWARRFLGQRTVGEARGC